MVASIGRRLEVNDGHPRRSCQPVYDEAAETA
jgi:hypothetical protein